MNVAASASTITAVDSTAAGCKDMSHHNILAFSNNSFYPTCYPTFNIYKIYIYIYIYVAAYLNVSFAPLSYLRKDKQEHFTPMHCCSLEYATFTEWIYCSHLFYDLPFH